MRLAVFKADVLLLVAAAIWGTGFVAQRMGMDHVGPMTFNGLRFTLAVLVLLPIIHFRRSAATTPAPGEGTPVIPGYLAGGCLAGSVLFVGVSLQQIGLIYTTAGKAGFITGLYVVLVPVIGLFLRHRVPAVTWFGAAVATGGLYCLSVTGALEVNRGDAFVLAGAVVWAAHVLVIGRLSPRNDPLRLATTQFSVVAALGLIAAVVAEDVAVETIMAAKWAILYGGVFPVAIAFTLQVIGQRDAPPAHAAILLSLEAVFAAVAGGILLSESLSQREVTGCVLMLVGVLISQIRRSSPRAGQAGPAP